MSFRGSPISCLFVLTAFSVLGCGGPTVAPGTGLDGGTDGQVVLAPGHVLPGVEVHGSIGPSTSDDYYIDLPTSGTYILSVAGNPFGPTLVLFTDSARTQRATYCDAIIDFNTCVSTLAAGRYYITAAPTGFSADYAFSITRSVDEGTSATPAVVNGDVTVRHTVSAHSSSYYRSDVPTSGAYDMQFYSLSGATLGYVTLTLFGDASFSGTPIGTCDYSLPGTCKFRGIAKGSLYIRADTTSADPGIFTLAPVHTLGEGALSDPVPLPGTPIASGLDAWSTSYYAFTTTDAGAYELTFGNTSVTNFEVSAYANGNTAGPAVQCTGVRCVLSGLEPATPYVITVDDNSDTHFDLSVARGLASGSVQSPVVIDASSTFSGQVEYSASGYYRFTAPTTAYYRASASALTSGKSVRLNYYPAGSTFEQTCGIDATNSCSLGPIAAGTTVLYRIDSPYNANVDFTLAIAPEPYGEGIPADPIVLSPGVDHVGSVTSSPQSYYRVVGDAVGGTYELLVTSTASISFSSGVSCTIGGTTGATRVCTFSVSPNATFDFSARTSSTTHDLVLHMSKVGVADGCEADALSCFDFEAGVIPAAITVAGNKPFKVSAASALRGTYGFENGLSNPGCFTFSTPTAARAITFSSELYSTSSFDDFTFTVDGTAQPARAASTTAGVRTRGSYGLVPGTAHTIQLCWNYSTASQYAYVDDIAIR